METLHLFFSHICGQHHCWTMAGFVLPMCQRCTGLYVGGLWAMICLLAFRPRPTSRVLWAHGMMLLIMAPFGYHLIPHGAVVRVVTGLLFGFGLTYYLVLNPALQLALFNKPANAPRYFFALAALVPAVLLAVRSDSIAVAWALSLAALGGVLLYAVLLATNIFLLPVLSFRMARGHFAGRPS